MSDADWLVENLIHWYGKTVSNEVFQDYLNTYIELSKPALIPMLAYKIFATRAKARSFRFRANQLGVMVRREGHLP